MAANQYMQPWFDTLSQGVQVAQSLRQAALQKQALDQAQQQFQERQDLAEKEFGLQQQLDKASLVGQGATPVDSGGNVSVTAPQPEYTPDAQGTLHPGLNFSSGPAVSVPADSSKPTVSIGGSSLQVPTLQDKLNAQIASQQATEAATYPTAKQVFGDTLMPGSDPNVRIPVNQMGPVYAGRAYAQGMRSEQPAAPKLVGHQITVDDKGNQTLVRSWDDGSVQETPLKGKGKTKEADEDGAGRRITPDAALGARQKALADYQKSSKEESELEQESLALGTALKSGQHYVDKNGNLKKFDPAATDEEKAAQQEDMRNRLTQVQKRTMQVIADKNDAMQRYGTKPQVSTAQAQAAIQGGMTPSKTAPTTGGPQKSQGPPPDALRQLKPGVATTFRNGQVWTLDANGKPTQVQTQGS